MSINRSEPSIQLTTTGTKTRERWGILPGRQKQRKVAGMTPITFSVCTCRVRRGQGSTADPVKLKHPIISTLIKKNMFFFLQFFIRSFIHSFFHSHVHSYFKCINVSY